MKVCKTQCLLGNFVCIIHLYIEVCTSIAHLDEQNKLALLSIYVYHAIKMIILS